MTRRLTALALAASFLAAGAGAARAAETLVVFAAGAVKAAVGELLPAFEAANPGEKTLAHYDTVGALRDRALAGEAAHVVLLSTPAIDAIAAKGRLAAGSRQPVGRTGVGLAGPKGSAIRVATPADLVATLRAAKSIGYADPARGATAGTHFQKLLGELGLAEPLKDRLKLYPFGVETIAAVGKGELEIGISQATEIVAHPDEVAFLGLLPDPHNIWTPYEAAALADTPAVRRLLAHLADARAQAAFRRIGFDVAR